MTTPRSSDPTPPLDKFLVHYDRDNNMWWRMECGHHQNLFEEAVERLREAEAINQVMHETLRQVVIELEIEHQESRSAALSTRTSPPRATPPSATGAR